MLLTDKQAEINVYKLSDDGSFDNIGLIEEYTSLIWPDKFNEFAEFELNALVTERNNELIQDGNIIWLGGENATLIEVIKTAIEDDGTLSYNVKGRTLEALLDMRVIWGATETVTGVASTLIYDLVRKHCISPEDTNRKIPFLECATDELIGGTITTQISGGSLYDAIVSIAQSVDIGFCIVFDAKNKKLIFKVVNGVNRTIEQTEKNPVVFDSDLQDLVESTYYKNSEEARNLAYVDGEETEDIERPHQTTTINESTNVKGLARRELYVDASDVKDYYEDDEGNTVYLTDEEYINAMVQKGKDELSTSQQTETFEGKIRTFGDVNYSYGVDFFEGDKVTIIDRNIGLQISARVSEVEEDFSDTYSLVLTFGYAYPTLVNKLKRKLSRIK
jgi:hypothetical protein